ncbi:MAG: L,D-transpeptidase [Deltaproteobacteria bacterium]|nr:L,D-transpeptidase [Deltaproteobacteria bacterium]
MRRLLPLLLLAACADQAAEATADLPLGDVEGDTKADGNGWGSALDCKAIPDLPALVAPTITVSLNGLTLHLTDAATGYDKVFPIGPGRIDQTDTDPEYGESLTYRPIIDHGTGDFAITPSSSVPCKTWWTDPDTGAKSPVFAGLPFMSWSGNYAIHGPIDNFRAPNGGTLRRGFVSHGCVRMEAADILEVYARVHTVARVPVHVQREPERLADGTTVDIPAKWIGSRCSADADCAFANGYCATNPVSGAGFCSAHCTSTCADKTGYPTTTCVPDPTNAAAGMCVPRALDQDYACRPFGDMAPQTVTRFHATSTASVCLPKSPGWIGDHCSSNADCTMGTTCAGATATTRGVCTQACTAICPDEPGFAETTCVSAPSLAAGGSCLRKCTASSNASECAADQTCTTAPRLTMGTRSVCMPRSAGLH